MPPPSKFFSPDGVGIATFFGTPIAGGILLAMNYRTLGEPQKGALAIVLSILATTAMVLVAIVLPIAALGTPLALGGVFGMRQIALATQGSRIAGGEVHSNWMAFGIGMGLMVAVFGFIIAALVLFDSHGTRYEVSSVEEIYYSGTATEADARTLADALKTLGFFDATKEKTVMLSKKEGTVTVGFVVGPKGWENKEITDAFTVIGSVLAPKLGKPLRVQLLDTSADVQKSIDIP